MAKEKYDYPYSDEKGNYTFRTIGGRKVKIYEHQSLADAMIESGKFSKKGSMRGSYRKEKEKDYEDEEKLRKEVQNDREDEEKQDKYAEKVIDNKDKYYSGRALDKLRQNKVDEELGQAEPVREKYRDEKQNTTEFKTRDELMREAGVEFASPEQTKGLQSKANDVVKGMAEDRQKDKVADYFKKQEENALKNKDYSYDYSKDTLSKMSDEDLQNYIDKQKSMNDEYTNRYNQAKTYDQRRKQNKQDTIWNGGMATKTERNLKDAQEELEKRNASKGSNVDDYLNRDKTQDKYSKNENTEKDNLYGGTFQKSEEKERLDIARDIAKELYQMNDQNSSQEKIDRVARELMEYTDGEVTNEKPYTDKNGNIQRSTQSLKDWRDDLKKSKEPKSTNETMNEAIRQGASKQKKVYTLDDGTPIDQNYMKELYSGRSYDEIKSQNDSEKEWLKNVKPEMRDRQQAFIDETDKYLANMERYESRISDDFSTRDRETGYPFSQGTAWEGTKSNSGLYGKDKIKAIDDEIKKAYPNLKTSRKTGQGGLTDSFSYSITESDKPIIRDINDFSNTEIERLYNQGYNKNWYNTKEDFKNHIKKELESGQFDINQYHIDNDYRLTPYGKQVFKDIMKVSNAYNYDESDSMTDYFNTGHYINLHVGKDGKPYQTTQKSTNSSMNDRIRKDAGMKDAFRQYKREHPDSKMTLNQYKKMVK